MPIIIGLPFIYLPYHVCSPWFQGSTEAVNTHFLLSDGVYAKAELPPTDTVMLWLGVSLVWGREILREVLYVGNYTCCHTVDVAIL